MVGPHASPGCGCSHPVRCEARASSRLQIRHTAKMNRTGSRKTLPGEPLATTGSRLLGKSELALLRVHGLAVGSGGPRHPFRSERPHSWGILPRSRCGARARTSLHAIAFEGPLAPASTLRGGVPATTRLDVRDGQRSDRPSISRRRNSDRAPAGREGEERRRRRRDRRRGARGNHHRACDGA